MLVISGQAALIAQIGKPPFKPRHQITHGRRLWRCTGRGHGIWCHVAAG